MRLSHGLQEFSFQGNHEIGGVILIGGQSFESIYQLGTLVGKGNGDVMDQLALLLEHHIGQSIGRSLPVLCHQPGNLGLLHRLIHLSGDDGEILPSRLILR